MSNVVNFKFINDLEDTIFISQINNPIKNFKTIGLVGKTQILTNDYNYIAIAPNQNLIVGLNAEPNQSYGFTFPFHLRIKYFKNGERKVMRVINSGNFMKPEPVVTQYTKPVVAVKKEKPIETKAFSLTLGLPYQLEDVCDLVFIRWADDMTDTFKLENLYTINFNVKDKELIYGMFYCEKYGVIAKYRHTMDFYNRKEIYNQTIPVYRLFENRNDYYYAGYVMSNIKQPYKLKEKSTYKLEWETKSTDRVAYYKEVMNYIRSLGYGSGEFIREPNLSKAVALERRLKNSKYQISMQPVDWYHSVSPEGWGGGYSVYANHFQITFAPNVSESWIKAFFKKYQIYGYTFFNNIYTFKFKYIISRSYMRILDKMWMKKEVIKIKQFKGGAPDMD
jgi:hypothetical protein